MSALVKRVKGVSKSKGDILKPRKPSGGKAASTAIARRGMKEKKEEMDIQLSARPDVNSETPLEASGFKVLVTGFDPKSKSVISFLQSKCSGKIKMSKVQFLPKRLTFLVSTRSEAEALRKLSGAKVDKHKITVRYTLQNGQTDASATVVEDDAIVKAENDADILSFTDEQVSLLRQFLAIQYRPELRVLDLSNLANMEVFKAAGFNLDLNQAKLLKILMRLISVRCKDVTSINFSNNNLKTLSGFDAIGNLLPDVINLSFDSNQIDRFETLAELKSVKGLRELHLTNNPISVANTDEYQRIVVQMFPSLCVLDSVSIPRLAPPFDAAQFLHQFITSFDQNRAALALAYHEHATLAVVVQCHHPGKWPDSHSLLVDPVQGVPLVFNGPESISRILLSLPPSMHLATPPMHVDTVCSTPESVTLKTTGYLLEESGVRRGFVRSLTLTPVSAVPSRPWTALVCRDELLVSDVPQ
eukprot:GILJ01007825.1.p1 GENE.GILJ01007825.1~~GILJ01007825.1.p1  ORF type:complete len:472 (+),score=61.52 GILJ01007825.1:41-1456(+)